jgi:hypothetical protein
MVKHLASARLFIGRLQILLFVPYCKGQEIKWFGHLVRMKSTKYEHMSDQDGAQEENGLTASKK